jgi:hypothetical protein
MISRALASELTQLSELLLSNIRKLEKLTPKIKASYLVYTGDTLPISEHQKAVRFDHIESIF